MTRRNVSKSPSRVAAAAKAEMKEPKATQQQKVPAKNTGRQPRSPARASAKPMQKEGSRSRSRSRGRPKKDTIEKAPAEKITTPKKSAPLPSADEKEILGTPSSVFVNELKQTVCDTCDTRTYESTVPKITDITLTHRKPVLELNQTEPSSSCPHESSVAPKQGASLEDIDVTLTAVKANISKYRYLYALIFTVLLIAYFICYAGYEVNRSIKQLQDQFAKYVIDVTNNYLRKNRSHED